MFDYWKTGLEHWLNNGIVGLSRLYRGMHYPTDVLAGALGGGLWMCLGISTLYPKNVRSEYRKVSVGEIR